MKSFNVRHIQRHLAAAPDRTASGLVSLDRRQRAAARASGLDVIELPA